METIQKDFRAFRTSLGSHPTVVIRREQWQYPVAESKFVRAQGLLDLPADVDVFVFGMVLIKQSPGSAKGMVFVTLEDETGYINLAFSPQVYARHYRLVDQQPFLCVVGKLQRQNESHSVLVKRVFDTDPASKLLRLPGRASESPADIAVELVKPRAFH